MNQDTIIEIGIDEEERLYVMPSHQEFPFIYREAVEVHWSAKRNCLYSPKPREWNYLDWFKHIIDAAKLQSVELLISSKTAWRNIPIKLKKEILNSEGPRNA